MYTVRCTLAACLMFLFLGCAYADDAVPKGPLPRNVVPTLVALELELDPGQTRFSGKTRIEAKVAQATNTIWMHGRDLTIEKAEAVTSDGKRIALTAASADVSGVLRMRSEETIPAGDLVIEIAYDAPFGELQGAYRAKHDGNDYIVTQMEPLGARNTFPSFDEPSFKQPWDITLIVPEHLIAVANSREAATEQVREGWKKVTFDRTEALPTYLLAFAVGPWDVPRGPDIAPHGSRSTPIDLRGLAAQGEGERMKYALDNTPAMVHALEDYFGTPYPFDKLDNVAAPDFGAGAMENAGLIIYRDILMLLDESSPANLRQAYWGVSAHELAHQWFGNLVTMEWWDDLWLNEAFATWMGNKITGQLQPQFHTDRNILEGGLNAMEADSLASTRRVHEPINDFTQIMSAFDVITYRKGGAVLAMFENYVGETNFRDGVRAYLKQHARGNATSADLIAAIAAESDDARATDAAFKSYIDQPGVPFLRIDVQCGDGKPALVVQQQRYLPIGSTASAEQTWGIPLNVRYDDGQIHEAKGIISQAQGRFELEDAQACPNWVMPNGHGAGYYRFALTPRWQQSLSDAFASLEEREQRVYADSITSAYDAGALSATQLLGALRQFAGAENRQTALAGLPQIEWMKEHQFDSDARRDRFLADVAEVYRARLRQLGLAQRDTDTDDDRLLRARLVRFFAETLNDETVRAEMNKGGRAVLGLDAGGKLAADAVPQDLRGVALWVAVQEGGASAFEIAEKHFRASQDSLLRAQFLNALGGSNDAKLSERARALIFEADLLRRNEIVVILESQFNEPALRPTVRKWVDSRFAELLSKLTPGGAGLVRLYAAGLCSAGEALAIEQTFAERVKTIEGGPLELKHAGEGIRLCAAAKQHRQDQPPQFASSDGE